MQKALKFLKENIVCGMSLDDMINKDKEPSPVLPLVKVKNLEKEYNNWGIYANNQDSAKALAVVFGNTDPPEVHESGYYGHYHDSTHSFHIWYGSPIFY